MKKIAILGFIFLMSGCAHNPAKVKDPVSLQDMLQTKISDPHDVLEWFKKCAKSCKTPDRDISKEISDGYETLYRVAAQSSVYAQLSTEQKALAISGQEKVRAGFLRILTTSENRDLLETAYRELTNAQAMYGGVDAEVQRVAQETIDRLKSKKTTAATGWYLTAITTPVNADNFLPVIDDYKSCLKIDKNDAGCKSGYDELVHYFERPRCQEPNFSQSVSVLGGKSKEAKEYVKKTSWGQQDFFIGANSILMGSDLLDGSLENSSPERNEILLNLKTFSVPKLAHFLQVEQAGPEDTRAEFFSMTLGDEILSVAPISANLIDGQLRLEFPSSAEAQKAFNRLCQKPTSEKLPEKLRL